MNSAYTVLWSREHRSRLRRSGDEGRSITVLFGGRHLSAPSLLDAGVGRGDVVFPLGVDRGRLLVLARVVVDRYVSLMDYIIDFLGCAPADVRGKSDIAL